MGRGGASKDREEGPERKCIATGEVQPSHGLIRFVVGPDGQIVPDILGKLPGRGIWVAASRPALDKAAKKNFDPARKIGPWVMNKAADHGLIVRALLNDTIAFCPPLIITEEQIDDMFDKFGLALDDALAHVDAA